MTGSSSIVRCTVDDLDRILDALIENAIHYGPAGGRIALVVAPGRLEIADEGPGSRRARRRRSSPASTAAPSAARRAGAGPGSAWRSPASSRRAGAATSRWPTAPAGGAVATITLPLADGTTPNEPVKAGAA